IVYAPASFVITVETTPVALLVAAIETPGKTAPVASVTVPVSVALLICAKEAVTIKHTTTSQKIPRLIFSPTWLEGIGGFPCHSLIVRILPNCSGNNTIIAQ